MRSYGEGVLRSEMAGDQGEAENSGGTSFSTECLPAVILGVCWGLCRPCSRERVLQLNDLGHQWVCE